jgi:protein-S-isoprenylcysteine O-methyltransferase Ste14
MPSAPTFSRFKLFGGLAYVFVWPAMLFAAAGTWHWLEGWVFGLWFVGISETSILWLYRRDPALLAERYRKPGTGGQSRADFVIVYGLLFGFLGWLVLPAFDVVRFGWTARLPLAIEVSGGVLLLGAAFFLFRSFRDNTFLSPLVRVQAERKQQVVSTGVYGFVRHPMYLGASLMFLGGPLLLGSRAGIAAGLALVLLLVVRIGGEETLLVRDLAGYDAYRAKVRYRLVPGVW